MAAVEKMKKLGGFSPITMFFSPENKDATKRRMVKKAKEVQKQESSTPRKSLQTIQLSAKEGLTRKTEKPDTPKKRKLEDNDENIDKPKTIKSRKILKKPVVVYKDPTCGSPDCVRSQEDKGTQTQSTEIETVPGECTCQCHKQKTAEEEAFDLMVNDKVPENYWKELAETRRSALNDTLEENEELHSKVKNLEENNKQLAELAEQAEYFANMFKMLTDKEENESPESKKEDESTEQKTECKNVEKCEESKPAMSEDSESDKEASVQTGT